MADEVVFSGRMHTLFVVAANVSLRSQTFETVIESLAKCHVSPSVFLFEHIRYFELFRRQLHPFYPDKVSDLGDDVANALLVVWEVDRVMPETHWARLKTYVASFSSEFFSRGFFNPSTRKYTAFLALFIVLYLNSKAVE